MKLHSLIRSKGLQDKKKRMGRGNASKYGNYSGKGHKGQKARAGGGVPAQFEGGQTPLVMRLPKRKGFKRYFKLITNHTAINLAQLEKEEAFKAGSTVTKEDLIAKGYLHKGETCKILAKGGITKKINLVDMDACSASALSKIEAAGGSVTVVSS
jgi:large subunit ribosomal protein L15